MIISFLSNVDFLHKTMRERVSEYLNKNKIKEADISIVKAVMMPRLNIWRISVRIVRKNIVEV